MKVSKGMFALIAGFAVSGAAMADDAAQPASTTAEKKAPIQTLVPGAYGKVDVRQDNLRAEKDDKTAYDKAVQEVLPKLGASLFDDKVDTSFTWRFRHENSTNVVKKYDFYNETQWNWVDGKFNEDSPYNFGPYSFVDFINKPDNQSDYSYADVGFYGEVNYQFAIPSGALALNFYEQSLGEFVTANDNNASGYALPVDNQTNKGANQLGLTDDGKGGNQAAPRDPLLINYSGTAIKYKPEAVKGLSIGLGVDVTNLWTPHYTEQTVDGDAQRKLDHYDNKIMTMNRLMLSYKISDKVTVSDQLRAYLNGYDQSQISTDHQDPTGQVGPYHWHNRLAISATLF